MSIGLPDRILKNSPSRAADCKNNLKRTAKILNHNHRSWSKIKPEMSEGFKINLSNFVSACV